MRQIKVNDAKKQFIFGIDKSKKYQVLTLKLKCLKLK